MIILYQWFSSLIQLTKLYSCHNKICMLSTSLHWVNQETPSTSSSLRVNLIRNLFVRRDLSPESTFNLYTYFHTNMFFNTCRLGFMYSYYCMWMYNNHRLYPIFHIIININTKPTNQPTTVENIISLPRNRSRVGDKMNVLVKSKIQISKIPIWYLTQWNNK